MLYFYQYDYPLFILLDAQDFESNLTLIREIKQELTKEQADSIHIIRSLLYYMLQILNRKYALHYHLNINKLENNCAYIFKNLIEENIAAKQRVNDYTEILGISRIALNNNVNKHFNTSTSSMIKKRLVNEIQNLLIYSGLSISEISQKLNFSKANHLMRFFKAQTGYTISEYMESYK